MAAVREETASARTLVLDVDGWDGHRAGQHVSLRLTAEDGYQAARDYSLASAAGEPPEVTVQRMDDGEVSPWFVDVAEAGDALEVRGPAGGWFVWDPHAGGPPLLLVAGGSGLVPLRSVLRTRVRSGDRTPVRLLVSARTVDDVLYRAELAEPSDGVEVVVTLTRGAPPGWTGRTGRLDRAALDALGSPPEREPDVYVCGPTAFVEQVASDLVALGHDPARVRTERFG